MLDLYPEESYEQRHQPSFELDEADQRYLLNNFGGLIKRQVALLSFHGTSSFDSDDMHQTALIALFEAAVRFDDIYSGAFPAYAKRRVRGAILDELRRDDSRSRRARQRAHELAAAEKHLTQTLGRKPSDSELAAQLNCDLSALRNAYQDQLHAQALSIEEALQNQPLGTVNENSHLEIKEELAQALKTLNQQDKVLLALIYQHELNQKEVAVVLNYTTARICQMHKSALARLRSAVDELRG